MTYCYLGPNQGWKLSLEKMPSLGGKCFTLTQETPKVTSLPVLRFTSSTRPRSEHWSKLPKRSMIMRLTILTTTILDPISWSTKNQPIAKRRCNSLGSKICSFAKWDHAPGVKWPLLTGKSKRGTKIWSPTWHSWRPGSAFTRGSRWEPFLVSTPS